MRELVRRVRDRLVVAEESVCLERAHLVTEAYARFARDPPPLRRAKAFAHVLQHMTLDVRANPVFAGNTSSQPGAWMLQPEYGFGIDPQVLVERDGLCGFLDGAVPEDIRAFWAERSLGGCSGIGHLAVDLGAVVHRGLGAIAEDVERELDVGGESQRVYRQAMLIALRGVMDWSLRYADAADRAAAAESDARVRECHLRVAEACRRFPAYPARNLFEGLQAVALVHLAIVIEGHGMSVSVGLPDRVLARFAAECQDREEAACLVAAFMLKLAGVSLLGSASKTQAITIGGVDHRGRDQCNAITRAFLDAVEIARVGDPHVFLRWHERIDEGVRSQAAAMLASGASMPLLVNDVPTAQGFMGAGVEPEDAYDYCVIGCNELGIPGRSAESAMPLGGSIQYLGLLNETLHTLPAPDAISDMPALLRCLEQTMARRALEMRRWGQEHKLRLAEQAPTPFTSALMPGCIERGADLLLGMKYRLCGVYERGLANAANALAAIGQVVFGERRLSMSQLLSGMSGDFADLGVRAALLAAPKWGCDDDRADQWASALVEMREGVLDRVDAQFGGLPHVSCHVVRSLHHTDGRGIGASPDGRGAGTPVADSIGASQGTATRGPTGVLNSVLKLDAARYYRGGTNLNITIPHGGAAPEVVRSMVDAFFGAGGQELQIGVLDAPTLRAAQRDPHRHGDLVVRISGFSARFVDLSRVEQEELIERAASAVACCPQC